MQHIEVLMACKADGKLNGVYSENTILLNEAYFSAFSLWDIIFINGNCWEYNKQVTKSGRKYILGNRKRMYKKILLLFYIKDNELKLLLRDRNKIYHISNPEHNIHSLFNLAYAYIYTMYDNKQMAVPIFYENNSVFWIDHEVTNKIHTAKITEDFYFHGFEHVLCNKHIISEFISNLNFDIKKQGNVYVLTLFNNGILANMILFNLLRKIFRILYDGHSHMLQMRAVNIEYNINSGMVNAPILIFNEDEAKDVIDYIKSMMFLSELKDT